MIDRKTAARLARQLYSKQINFEIFMMKYPDIKNDVDINELYDLIEHEPKIGGLLGISPEEHKLYMVKINNLIDKLEQH